MEITYEINLSREPLHPDPDIIWRFQETAMSDCAFGCKIYADPRSNVRILAHNPSYGCTKKP